MPEEIHPSSYRCDCGFQSDHFEGTIRELKQLSRRGPQRLGADDSKQVIVFSGGRMTARWCPQVGRDLPADEPT